ncbi:MAG TPA: hypothetical protein VFK70_02635 [Vicinamibacteria bacterium]|nr:hypothetical protein [Vicinamibacteria bacterium]
MRLPPAADNGLRILSALLAVLVIAAFRAIGGQYYQDFRVPQGFGMDAPLPVEFAYYTLFLFFGLSAIGLLAFALARTSLPAAARAVAGAAARRPMVAAAVAATLLVLGVRVLAREALDDGVLSDDEHVYSFIAQTLRTGALTAKSPGTDLEFFLEQFVVTTDKVRYGKYPVGFPLLLLAGQVAGLERAVVPVLTGLLALLLVWVGRKAFSPTVVTVALVLFVLSPQVLITGASLLSQPAAAVCLLGASGCLLESVKGGRRAATWAAGAGAFLAYGVLVRPLPGVFFAAVAVAWAFAAPRLGLGRALSPPAWLGIFAPLAVASAVLLWTNYVQTGHPLHSGYQTIHGDAVVLHSTLAPTALSLASSLVRLNFWLFGWPLSLVFCFFARRTAAAMLFWGMFAAEVAYRLVAPKAGIGVVGPVYFYEVVPLLCLSSAEGLAQLARRGAPDDGEPASGPAVRSDLVAATILSAVIVSLTLFLPYKLADAARSGQSGQVVYRALKEKDVHHALVFHRGVVPPGLGLSWAYYPRPNGPRLDDDVLFVVMQPQPDRIASNVEFWKRRFPDRQAWVFDWDPQTGPTLVPLPAFLSSLAPSAPPPPPTRP